ncbi:MAG TPA: class I SAM-dependent methyltransferase [Opitutaceae bacterium]
MSEIERGDRFAFGENWARFLKGLTEQKIDSSQRSISDLFGQTSFAGLSFLDIGSGSGLSSLVAARMGAEVRSVDFDPQSVACTDELRSRYFRGSRKWTVEQGSALDAKYMRGLGLYDIVYSWGVLHHTGNMWLGIENAIACVKPDGRLMLAIYNDQGWKSRFWWLVKATYNALPKWASLGFGYALGYSITAAVVLRHLLFFRFGAVKQLLFSPYRRGMSRRHDMIDWMGGFPFEVATATVLTDYMAARGFTVEKAVVAASLGCHEIIFRRRS